MQRLPAPRVYFTQVMPGGGASVGGVGDVGLMMSCRAIAFDASAQGGLTYKKRGFARRNGTSFFLGTDEFACGGKFQHNGATSGSIAPEACQVEPVCDDVTQAWRWESHGRFVS